MEPQATTLKKQATIMELAFHFSPVLPRYSMQSYTISPFRHCYSRYQFITSGQFLFQANTSNSNRDAHLIFSFSKKQQQLWISDDEDDYYDGEEEEEEESNILSLSEKPERNMTLLDDYELEELDYASDPNHRSGELCCLRFCDFGRF